MDLTGNTALVTGSSKNIGRATAVRLTEAGADVGVTARRGEAGCEETARRVRETGSEAAVALGDIGEPDDIDAVVDHVRDRLGPIDVLVNNATSVRRSRSRISSRTTSAVCSTSTSVASCSRPRRWCRTCRSGTGAQS